jgi:hypothetical protein
MLQWLDSCAQLVGLAGSIRLPADEGLAAAVPHPQGRSPP